MKVTAMELLSAMTRAKNTGMIQTLLPYQPSDDLKLNEYCLFLKPELTESNDRFEAILDLVSDHFIAANQEFVSVSVLDAQYLERHKLMEQHYGVIDEISRRGTEALAEEAKMNLGKVFEEDIKEGIDLLGANQFLAKYPYFTAEALAVLYDNLGNNKLGAGSHCVRAVVRGRPTLIFNGFHPEQLLRYIKLGSCIVAFTMRTDVPWKHLRTVVTGATNPTKANPESIRGKLLAAQAKLGLPEVSSGMNGVHVSAGPIEGMVEICRYMSDLDKSKGIEPTETTFGRLLLSNGVSEAQIGKLQKNGIVQSKSRLVPVFDLTEECDALPASMEIAAVAADL